MGKTDKPIFKIVGVLWSWNFHQGVPFIINADRRYTERQIV